MKVHTNNFKNGIILHGRELDSKITYELNGETIELGNAQLNSVTPHYEANILKSVMKQLDLDSNVDIPLMTTINYQFGLKVGNSYEYLNYGNYIVYSSEKQEATNSYKIVCYDKMLYSMVDYFDMSITYPISIRDYINTICTNLGLVFANANSTFANYDKEIQEELYLTSSGNSLNYKFRDVLDELAQVTASTICINNNDQLEIRYITDTHDTIDEHYFKDINVAFGKKYGPVNSIVLSRSAQTDNVYLKDQQSIDQNGLCEIKIVDNQIMNWNDRSNYLPDILGALGGLEYYLNDFSSTGIMYYEMCDRYTAHIGENNYSCIMFNDEVLVTQGLQENIHTDMPEESETDYSKADKTDRKINETYLIVDKQNQTISSVVSSVSEQDQKISQINQSLDELSAQISDIADITISGESAYATFELDRINESEPIMIKVHSTGDNISYLYPRSNLYPSDTLYMPDRKIRFYNETTGDIIDYTLPDDLLYYDSEHYDEFYLDYESQTCQVTKRCQYNADGTVSLLANEIINTYTYPTINLTEGDYTISVYGYNYGYLFARLMSQNIYTSQFYTKAETNTLISQTSQSINLSVDTKLSNYSTTNEMNSAITLKANQITSSVSETYATKTTTNQLSSRISQTAKSIDLTVTDNGTSAGLNIKVKNEDGTQIDEENANITLSGLVKFTDLSTSGSTTINGANIQTGTLSANQITTGTLNGNNVSITNLNASNIKSGTLTSRAINNGSGTFSVSTGGSVYARSGTIGGWSLNSGYLYATSTHDNQVYKLTAQGIDNGTSVYWWGNFFGGSDKNLKNNIENIDEKFEKFYDDLKPVSFYFNKGVADDKKHFGFIAQDVDKSQQKINEDLSMIERPEDNKYYSLYKEEIIALNTWQIQKLKQEIKELKQEIEELKKGK